MFLRKMKKGFSLVLAVVMGSSLLVTTATVSANPAPPRYSQHMEDSDHHQPMPPRLERFQLQENLDSMDDWDDWEDWAEDHEDEHEGHHSKGEVITAGIVGAVIGAVIAENT